ncbi:MAG: hypothetical protein QOD92_2412 [Acidimicrobiaceae bacterium]|jgi:hypothetical protein
MRRTLGLLVATVALMTTGCRDDHVTITYQPRPGAAYEYTIHVVSSTTSAFPGSPASQPPVVPADITARHRVLDASDGTTRVEVQLEREGLGQRTFVMRFDRAAQLTAVESVEGIPAEALGSLGLSEIFPVAAGAPPDRRLRPGDRWVIDDQVQLAGMDAPARLSGTGRLVQLGVVDGHKTATVSSTTTLPLTATSTTSDGVQTLTGTQTTTITVVYDLADGAVRHSTATTSASYDVMLNPPTGRAGAPIKGSLTVKLQSETRRSG